MKSPGPWLIVGGDGCIGSRLAADAGRYADSVVASSRRAAPRSGQIFADLAAHDTSALMATRPAVVFLCAAMTSMRYCHDHPAVSRETNVNGTVRVAKELAKQGCFIVFLSSNAVFDGKTERPDEESSYSPTTEYGRQKVSAEEGLSAISRDGGSVAIVRLSKVLTPASGITAEFIKRLKAGEPCPAFNDLRMSPVSLSFVSDSLLAIAKAKHSGIFHLSGAEEMTYADLAVRLSSCLGADGKWVRPIFSKKEKQDILFRPEHPALGMRRTKEMLGIVPETTAHLMKQLAGGDL
jgi:dTDP-4-dehydrorhamnose reductase